MSLPPEDVTRLLLAWSNGNRDALEDLVPVVYGKLRRIADRYFRHERAGHTLQATALVHEAYFKLVDVIALDDALARLTALYPEQGRLVELRYFGGLTIEETGEVMGVSPATVKRQWMVARAWLVRDLKSEARL